MIKTMCSQHRRDRFNLSFLGQGTKIPHTTPHDLEKKKKTKEKKQGRDSQDYLFIFGCAGSLLLLCGPSLVKENRGYSSCAVWASHFSSSSLWSMDSRHAGFSSYSL